MSVVELRSPKAGDADRLASPGLNFARSAAHLRNYSAVERARLKILAKVRGHEVRDINAPF